MIVRFIFIISSLLLLFSCASTNKAIKEGSDSGSYTVKVLNQSSEKAILRFQLDDNGYTFRFVDNDSFLKFEMSGELSIQYSVANYDDAKILMIKQHTLIKILPNEIVIDDLPVEDIIKKKHNEPIFKK